MEASVSQLVRLESGPRHTPEEALALTVADADAVTVADSVAAADAGSSSSLMSGFRSVSRMLYRLRHDPVLERMRPTAGEWLRLAAPLMPFALTVSVSLAGLNPTLSEPCRAPAAGEAGEIAPECEIVCVC